MGARYTTFKDFYPFYLGEHSDRACRRMHFIGSSLVLLTLLGVLVTGRLWGLALMPLFGYGFAWMGHFFFEKNRPATFTYPLYSFLGDWVMYRDIVLGRITL
jgi:hypothetical protein